MPLTFVAEDNEFATSTGGNIASGYNRSRFDGPPSDSVDLVITSNVGASEPRLFEVGNTYDISFGGPGGTTIEDAVVLRSDAAPGDGGVIVFSGLDQSGDPTQVVWAPAFDLDGWYNDNYYPRAEPEFYNTDTNSAYTHKFVCFAAQTRIKVPGGAVMAGNLRPGDLVCTLDQGSMPLIWTGQCQQPGRGTGAPVLFMPGSIGNHAPLRLSLQHRVMVQSARAEMMFGSSQVLVPAKAMINGRDILLAPCRVITYVHLLLASHQILSAEGGPCESLLMGDMAVDLALPDAGLSTITQCARRSARPVLTYTEARTLLSAPRGISPDRAMAAISDKDFGQRLRRRNIALV